MSFPKLYARCQVRIIADASENVAQIIDSEPERFIGIGDEAREALIKISDHRGWLRREVREEIALGFQMRHDLDVAWRALLRESRNLTEATGGQGKSTFRHGIKDAARDLQVAYQRFPKSVVEARLESTNRWYKKSKRIFSDPRISAVLGGAPAKGKWPLRNAVDLGAAQLVTNALMLPMDCGDSPILEPTTIATRFAAARRSLEILEQIDRQPPKNWKRKEVNKVSGLCNSLMRLQSQHQ